MKERLCPRCGMPIIGYPAISRRDNKTEICSQCGIEEAMEDWFKWRVPDDELKGDN